MPQSNCMSYTCQTSRLGSLFYVRVKLTLKRNFSIFTYPEESCTPSVPLSASVYIQPFTCPLHYRPNTPSAGLSVVVLSSNHFCLFISSTSIWSFGEMACWRYEGYDRIVKLGKQAQLDLSKSIYPSPHYYSEDSRLKSPSNPRSAK